MRHKRPVPPEEKERALLVQVILAGTTRQEAADSLAELARLADTAGVKVLDTAVQRRRTPAPAYCIGGGDGSCLIGAADILAWQGLCLKLTEHRNLGPSRRVWELLGPEPRRAVEAVARGGKGKKEDREKLIKALKSVVPPRNSVWLFGPGICANLPAGAHCGIIAA